MTLESVAREIAKAITTWEKYNWKYTDLWDSFQDNFEGYMEDDFRLVNKNGRSTKAPQFSQKTRRLDQEVKDDNSQISI